MFSPSLQRSALRFFDFLAFVDGSSPFISFAEKINEVVQRNIGKYLAYHITRLNFSKQKSSFVANLLFNCFLSFGTNNSKSISERTPHNDYEN